MQLDTLIQVETPEAIDIQLRPASLLQRIIAFKIDLLIRFIWFCLSSIALLMFMDGLETWIGSENAFSVLLGLFFINLFVTTWLYSVVFEVFNQGRTIGKMVMKIRVVHENGSPIGWSAAMLRNLLRVFDGLPMGYAIGMACMMVTEKSQRVGDLFAGTLVISDHIIAKKTALRLDYLQDIPAQAPPYSLTREEQYSIVSFTERHHQISRNRQLELAEQLCYDLSMPSDTPIRTVLSMGKYYLGEHKDNT